MSQPTTDPIEVLKALIAIPSINPVVDSAGAGERKIIDHIGRWFERHGFEVDRLEQQVGRPSLVAVGRGTGGGLNLMLNGHVDTTGVAGYRGDPFDPKEEGGRIYGRGSCEMKAGVAAMMVAAVRILKSRVKGDVVVACVADQEGGAAGTKEVLRSYSADGAIVPEPSGLNPTVCHKGMVWLDVAVVGKAAHGSRPDLGVDAIAKAGHFLVALDRYASDLAKRDAHPILGSGSVHASFIAGGTDDSEYPAECVIRIERRILPDETPALVVGEIESLVEQASARDALFRARVTVRDVKKAFAADMESQVCRSVLAALRNHSDAEPVLQGEPFWLDTALLQEAGIPSVIIGPTGEGVHDTTEWIDTASVLALTDILAEAGTRFCGIERSGPRAP